VSGDSAYRHVQQFLRFPLSSRIVVLQYGINDAGQGYAYEPALAAMVDHVIAEGRVPLITGLSRVREGAVPRRDAYDAIARHVAQSRQVVFADWGAVPFDPADMADPVHPGPRYAERLTRQLAQALDRVAPECAGGVTLLHDSVPASN